MAPERIGESDGVDARTDVYGVGAMLHFLIAGRAPFDGDDQAALLREVLSDARAATRACGPGIPAALDDLVARCLAKAPAERPGSGPRPPDGAASRRCRRGRRTDARAWWELMARGPVVGRGSPFARRRSPLTLHVRQAIRSGSAGQVDDPGLGLPLRIRAESRYREAIAGKLAQDGDRGLRRRRRAEEAACQRQCAEDQPRELPRQLKKTCRCRYCTRFLRRIAIVSVCLVLPAVIDDDQMRGQGAGTDRRCRCAAVATARPVRAAIRPAARVGQIGGREPIAVVGADPRIEPAASASSRNTFARTAARSAVRSAPRAAAGTPVRRRSSCSAAGRTSPPRRWGLRQRPARRDTRRHARSRGTRPARRAACGRRVGPAAGC